MGLGSTSIFRELVVIILQSRETGSKTLPAGRIENFSLAKGDISCGSSFCLVKKFTVFCKTRSFIALFTTARHKFFS
jgi:hypothetical protein